MAKSTRTTGPRRTPAKMLLARTAIALAVGASVTGVNGLGAWQPHKGSGDVGVMISKRGPTEGPATHQLSKREFTLITRDDLLKSYDYVVVGGGLAGLVIASRLSEDKDRSVLVLEAGKSGDEVKEDIDAPAGAYYNSIVGTDYDWKYLTTNQPRLNNRAIYWPRGKILGGSTAMNAMYLVRPSQIELDTWSSLLASDSSTSSGADLWNWENMYAAMKKSENFSAPLTEPWEIANQFPLSAENHGSGGPMQLGYPGVMFTAVGNWTEACDRAGVGVQEEPNGGITMGGFITPSSLNQANWTRSYSRSAYIDSLPPRSNLHILPEATVTKLGFSDKARASFQGERDQLIANTVEFGSEFRAEGEEDVRYVVGVNREVILSGGPMGSPKVLMHSGVGPRDVLEQIGLDVKHALPGVGQHMQDHLTAGVVYEARVETAGDLRATGSDFSRSTEFLSFINDAVAFANITRLFGNNSQSLQEEINQILTNVSTSDSTTTPDGVELSLSSLVPEGSAEVIEGYKVTYNLTANAFFEDTAQVELLMSLISPGVINIQSALQRPLSRGRVYINSTNELDPIIIEPNYFSHPVDRVIMRQGVRLVRDIFAALREMEVVGEETQPGPNVQSDEELDRWLTDGGASTQYHVMGSCPMLPLKYGGCVNSKLKVYGLANVRVADSSVYPYEFAAHLASVTFGLGETASEIVKGEAYTVPNNAKVNENSLGKQEPTGEGTIGGAVRSGNVGWGLMVWAGVVGAVSVWIGM